MNNRHDWEMCGDDEGRALRDCLPFHLEAQVFIGISLPIVAGFRCLLHPQPSRQGSKGHSNGRESTTLSVRHLPRACAWRLCPS